MSKPSQLQQIADILGLGSAEVRRAFTNERSDRLSDIPSINSIKVALEEYTHAFPGSRRKELVHQRWIAICANTKQLHQLWSLTKSEITGQTRDQFIEHWLDVSTKTEEVKELVNYFYPFKSRELRPIVDKVDQLLKKARKSAKRR